MGEGKPPILPCAGLVETWGARLGQLDASTGEFTAREGSAAPAGSHSSGREGFCGFLGPGAVYVGVPGMDATCRGPCSSSHPGLTTKFGERVRQQPLLLCCPGFATQCNTGE